MAWHSSGAITSFMAVLLLRFFMSQLDLWVSAAGSVRQNKIKLAIVCMVKSKISITEGFSWSYCVVR
jgi:hypothetical protein